MELDNTKYMKLEFKWLDIMFQLLTYFPKTTCALKKKKKVAQKDIQEHTEKCSTVVSRKHFITTEICVCM